MSPFTPLGTQLIYFACTFAVQSLTLGACSVIIFLSTRMLMKRGLKTKVNRNLLMITLGMYALAFVYWAYSFANMAVRVQGFVDNPTNSAPNLPVTKFLTFFNAIVTINYILSDVLIVWRARLITAPEHRKYMVLPSFFVVIGGLCLFSVIGMRVAALWSKSLGNNIMFARAIDILQVSAMNLSLISNFTTTAVVGVTAWQHRQIVREGFKKRSQGDRILKLLLESGVIYCLFGVGVLVSSFVRLPYNTLGDVWMPISVIIASAYTPTILLLVHSTRELNEATFLGSMNLEDLPAPAQFSEHEPKLGYPVVRIGPVPPKRKSPDIDANSLGMRPETSTVREPATVEAGLHLSVPPSPSR